MKNSYKRSIVSLLTAALLGGNLVLPIAATQQSGIHADHADHAQYTAPVLNDLKQFTGTDNLIKDTISDLMQNGASAAVSGERAEFAEDLKANTGYTLDEVESYIGSAFFVNRKAGEFDTSRYHFDRATMETVLDGALERYHLADVTDYKLITRNGEVTKIKFGFTEIFEESLNDIDENDGLDLEQRLKDLATAETIKEAQNSIGHSADIMADGDPVTECTHENTEAMVPPVDPTCTEPGKLGYAQCSDCKQWLIFNADGSTTVQAEEPTEEQLAIPALGHDLHHTPAKDATCVEAGNIDYYTCSRCEKIFADEKGENPVEDVTIPATGKHTVELVEAKEANCKETGNHAYYRCTVCGDCFTDAEYQHPTTVEEQTIPTNDNHDWGEWKVTRESTSTEPGEETRTCKRCGAPETRSLPLADVTVTFHWNGYTCESATVTDGSKTTEVAVVVTEKTTPATHYEDGKTVYTAVCEYEGVEYTSRKTEVLPQGKHEYTSAPEFVWNEDGSACTANFSCECGYVEKVVCEIAETVKSEPTHLVPGEKECTATCEFQGKPYTSEVKTFEIPVTPDHTYGDPTYEWSEDYKTCTANFACECGHVEKVPCEVTENVTKPATHTEEGAATYTAKCEFEESKYSTSKDVVLPKIPHDYKLTVDWGTTFVLNADADGDGQPDPGLIYTTDGNDPRLLKDPQTGYPMWNPNTGVGVSVVSTVAAVAQPEATVICSDPTCPENHEGAGKKVQLMTDADGNIMYTTIAAMLTTDPHHPMLINMADNSVIDPGQGDPIMNGDQMICIAIMKSVLWMDEAGQIVSDAANETKLAMDIHWASMSGFIRDNPEYFGYSAPYWLSKNTADNPLNAVKYMCNLNEMAFVPDPDLDYMVNMIGQAFMSYVMTYGDALLAMFDDAQATLDDRMTDVQKILVLHDWLASVAEFDMNDMLQQTQGGEGSDPIAMTAFGALLSSQIGMDGSVCLAYASAFTCLVQRAFNVTAETAADAPIVDFVRIQYLANVAATSVAGQDSGFGTGEAAFGSPHYFNAVKIGDQWYYVDACYNDVRVMVISQYRVETNGNISHLNFLTAPTTAEEQYKGNYQYLDSLYDGKVWERVPDPDTGGRDYKYMDGNYNVLTAAEAAQYKQEGKSVYYYYEAKEVTYPEGDTTPAQFRDIRYTDTTYEEVWFSKCVSDVMVDKESGNFYYVYGNVASFSSMRKMMDQMEGHGGEGGGMGDMMGGDNLEKMMSAKDNPTNADKIVSRPIGAPDVLPKAEEAANPAGNGIGGMDAKKEPLDPNVNALFHFGYGTYGAQAQKDVVYDHENSNPMDDFMNGPKPVEESRKGPFFDRVVLDRANYAMYPDMTHSLVLDEQNGQLLFNLDNCIYAFDLSKKDVQFDNKTPDAEGPVKLVKEYNTVTYGQNDRAFVGMSYFTNAGSEKMIENHPLAAIDLHNLVYWEDTNDDGQMDKRNSIPMLYASIATNLSFSYKPGFDPDSIPDEEKTPYDGAYAEEAYNFNPTYIHFLEQKEKDKEETAKDENKNPNEVKNSNFEFMWCANVVDMMPWEQLVYEFNNPVETETVTIAATCDKPGYTESRTTGLGLSVEGTRTQNEDALGHHYVLRAGEKVMEDGVEKHQPDYYMCHHCLRCQTQKTVEDEKNPIPHGHIFGDKAEFTWNEDFTAATAVFKCIVDGCTVAADGMDREANELPATTCDVKASEDGKTVTATATLEYGGKTHTATETINLAAAKHEHVYADETVEFIWTRQSDGSMTAVAVFTCTETDPEICNEETEGHTLEVNCEVTYNEETGMYVAKAVNPTTKTTVAAQKRGVLLGDVNEDGEVNITDMQRLYEHLNKTSPLTEGGLLAADVNESGDVDISDMQRLYEHLNGTNPLGA